MFCVPIVDHTYKNFYRAKLHEDLDKLDGKDLHSEAEIYKKLIKLYPAIDSYPKLLKEVEEKIRSNHPIKTETKE